MSVLIWLGYALGYAAGVVGGAARLSWEALCAGYAAGRLRVVGAPVVIVEDVDEWATT